MKKEEIETGRKNSAKWGEKRKQERRESRGQRKILLADG